jgi:TRAP-type uncharacterized transport system fused permease subunit
MKTLKTSLLALLAGGFQGWALKRTTLVERWMLLVAGFALVYPSMLADAPSASVW